MGFRKNRIMSTKPQIQPMGRLVGWFMMLCSIGFASSQPSHISAQSYLVPIYTTSGYISHLSWSVDGGAIAFGDEGWHLYDTSTRQLSVQENWPFQTILTSEEIAFFSPATDGKTLATIYQSPDQQYIIYGGEGVSNYADQIAWQLNIGNRATREFFASTGVILFPFATPNTFDVIWSADSTAFVVTNTTFGGHPEYIYGTNYADDLADIKLENFRLPSGEPVGLFDGDAVYDISNDGSSVLLRYTKDDPNILSPNELSRQLAVWRPLDFNATQILTDIDARRIIGASFAPYDANKILFVNEVGLIEYDLVTTESRIISDEVSASTSETSPLEQAIFSPDGHRIALKKEIEYGTWGVYVIHLSYYRINDAEMDGTLSS